jgi:hypothetical protein
MYFQSVHEADAVLSTLPASPALTALASIKTITFKLLPTLPAPSTLTAMQGMSFRYQASPPFLPNYIHHRKRAYPYDLALHKEVYYPHNVNLIPRASIGFTAASRSSSRFLPSKLFQFNYVGCRIQGMSF